MVSLLESIKSIYPEKFYQEPTPGETDVILQEIITLCINKLVTIGDQSGKQSHEQFTPPNKKLPSISVKDYLFRLFKYSPCSKECFIASLIYIDRLIKENNFIITSFNIHRLLITTLVISTKYLDDIYFNNEFYSQVGGINLKEMNSLEMDFLKLVNFSAVCPDASFEEYTREMEKAKERFLNHKRIPLYATVGVNGSTTPPSSSPRNRASFINGSRRGSCDDARPKDQTFQACAQH